MSQGWWARWWAHFIHPTAGNLLLGGAHLHSEAGWVRITPVPPVFAHDWRGGCPPEPWRRRALPGLVVNALNAVDTGSDWYFWTGNGKPGHRGRALAEGSTNRLRTRESERWPQSAVPRFVRRVAAGERRLDRDRLDGARTLGQSTRLSSFSSTTDRIPIFIVQTSDENAPRADPHVAQLCGCCSSSVGKAATLRILRWLLGQCGLHQESCCPGGAGPKGIAPLQSWKRTLRV
jgi:hypothetical protein